MRILDIFLQSELYCNHIIPGLIHKGIVMLKRHVIVLLLLIPLSILGFFWLFKRYLPHQIIDIKNISASKNLVPVAIIGSGPAGLSAALYAARMNYYTVVFKGSMPGGQLTQTTYVENWPGVGTMLGPDIMKKLERQALNFGVQFVPEGIEKADLTTWPYRLWTEDGNEVKALSIIISTGSKPKRLNIEGETKFWGKGVTTCAVCDAPFYKDKNVVVVGGGDSAAEEAMELAAVAKSVVMLVRGKALRASAIMQDRIKGYPNIAVRYDTQVKEILGDEHVTGVLLSDGARLAIDGVFLAIGHIPNTEIFKPFITCDEQGYIQLKHPLQHTSKEGIFAAGDVADYRYRQAGIASGDGIKAALDAAGFLRDLGFNEVVAKQWEHEYFDTEKDLARAHLQSLETAEQFEKLAKTEKLPLVLDFYAPYCPSCMQMIPVVESVASKLADKFVFVKVDTSKSDALAKRFHVTMIPMIIVIKDGKLISRTSEVMNKRQLTQFLQKSDSLPTQKIAKNLVKKMVAPLEVLVPKKKAV